MLTDSYISIVELRKRFTELVCLVAYTDCFIIITRYGKPMARLVAAREEKRGAD